MTNRAVAIRVGLLLLFLQSGLASFVHADAIQVRLSETILANAEYRVGDPARPAVFILHGFLSTHSFNTVQILIEGLADAGYTVLAPTLSLNVSDRRQGLDCEAIHTHTVASDVQEIARWVGWLEAQGHHRIVLVGHSTGSLLFAQYLNGQPSDSVRMAVLTAPGYFGGRTHSPAEEGGDMARARQMLTQGGDGLGRFSLSYCHGNYTGTAASYLSYIEWGVDRLTGALAASEVPVVVVLAGADARFGEALHKRLLETRVPVRVVPGAGHFFDSPYEFEFVDAVTQILGAHDDSGSSQTSIGQR